MSEKEKKEVNCKWDKAGSSSCRQLSEGKEVTDLECVLCIAEGFKDLTTTFAEIIAEMGAGERVKDFLGGMIRLVVNTNMFDALIKEKLPEYYVRGRKVEIGVINLSELAKTMKERGKRYVA